MGESLPQAEVVEALAHGHRAERLARADTNFETLVGCACARGERRSGFLQHHIAALALNHRIDGIAQRLQGLARQAAGAGFMPGKAALVQQKHALTRMGEIIGGSAARWPRTGNQNVVKRVHLKSL